MKFNYIFVIFLFLVLVGSVEGVSANVFTDLFKKSFSKPQLSPLGEDVYSLSDELASYTSFTGELKLILSSLRGEREEKISQMNEIAVKRQFLMMQMAKESPHAFLDIAQQYSDKLDGLPSEVQLYVEKEFSSSGIVNKKIYDDFDNDQSWEEYELIDSGEALEFYPSQELEIVSGTSVDVRGFKLASMGIAVADNNNIQVNSVPQLDSVGEQKTLVLLVKYLGQSEMFTKERAQEVIFGVNSPFQKFFQENSYGKVSFSGEVMGWYTLDRYPQRGFDFSDADLNNIITSNNINIDVSQYDRVVILLLPLTGYGGYSSVGKEETYIKGKRYFFSLSVTDAANFPLVSDHTNLNHPGVVRFYSVLGHEVGHGLGLLHAKGLQCRNAVYGGECSILEYGNYYDTMGSGSLYHFNSIYKDRLGWLDSSEVLRIRESGRYILNPLESNSGVKLATVYEFGSSEPLFSLEYRKGIGYDSQLNYPEYISNQEGLMINKISPHLNRNYLTFLLDMTPSSDNWFLSVMQTTLNPGNVFEDPTDGITITPINSDESQIVFDVEIKAGTCFRTKPQITSLLEREFVLGNKNYFYLSVNNPEDNIKCDGSDFIIDNLVVPSGWSYRIYSYESNAYQDKNSLRINPGEEGFFRIDVIPSGDSELGEYSMSFGVININSWLRSIRTIKINLLPPPSIKSVNPTSALPKDKIILEVSSIAPDNIFYLFQVGGEAYYLRTVYSSDGRVEFEIPTRMSQPIPNHFSSSTIPTPLGKYRLWYNSYAVNSNEVVLNIDTSCFWPPTPESTTMKTLHDNLLNYDSDGDRVGNYIEERLLCYEGRWYATVNEWSYFKEIVVVEPDRVIGDWHIVDDKTFGKKWTRETAIDRKIVSLISAEIEDNVCDGYVDIVCVADDTTNSLEPWYGRTDNFPSTNMEILWDKVVVNPDKSMQAVFRVYVNKDLSGNYELGCWLDNMRDDTDLTKEEPYPAVGKIVKNVSFNGCVTNIITCVDSDGGKDYLVKGKVTGQTERGYSIDNYDSCTNSIRLSEFFCYAVGDDYFATWETYNCENLGMICSDGACVAKNVTQIPQNKTCFDSDGYDTSKEGYVEQEGVKYSDECVSGNEVREYYCGFNIWKLAREMKSKVEKCKGECVEGKCAGQEEKVFRECQDNDPLNKLDVKGNVVYQGENYEDKCEEQGKSVRQYFCVDNKLRNFVKRCPEGTRCGGGVCG